MNTLKKQARGALVGNYGVLIFSLLMIELFTSIIVYVFTMQNASLLITVLSSIIIALLGAILETGIRMQCLKAARDEAPAPADVLICFGMHPDTVVLIAAVMELLEFLLSLPLFLCWLLRAPGKLLPAFMSTSSFMAFGYLILSLVWIAAVISVMLRFAPIYYIYLDHSELSLRELLAESNQRMQGHRIEFLLLVLSFIGYGLLALFTFGIGLLWIVPYMEETFAMFYLKNIQ